MKYYVWLEYYLSPAGKNVKSTELQFYNGHQHGVAPSQGQVNSLQPDLQAAVASAATKANVVYPGNQAVQSGRSVKTRSEK
jgi:hypothetical protein